MIMRSNLLLIMLLITGLYLNACKSRKDVSNNEDEAKQTEQAIKVKTITDETVQATTQDVEEGMEEKKYDKEKEYRVIISFISIGEGPSLTGHDKLQNFLNFQNENTEKNLKCDTIPWGREGEVDYCFTLEELSEGEQENFMGELRRSLEGDELIRIEENTVCRHIR